MKKYRIEEEQVVRKELKVLDKIICDICKAETSNDWSKDYCYRAEVEVSLNEGDYWPEGPSGEKVEIDLCPDCFNEKLIPWVRSQGGEETRERWYW